MHISFRQLSSSYSVLALTEDASNPTTPLAASESQEEAIKHVFSETNMDVDMLVTDSSGVWNEVHCEVCRSHLVSTDMSRYAFQVRFVNACCYFHLYATKR